MIQRWAELFDRDATPGVRCSPIPYQSVRSERARTDLSRFHKDILDEELSDRSPAESLGALDNEALKQNPIEWAERLAISVSALGFNHAFLFQAYRRMLYPPKESLNDRIDALREWWLLNSAPRDMAVAFRISRTGRLPPHPGLGLELVRWKSLPQRIREAAKECVEWRPHFDHCEEDDPFFLLARVSARDPDGAALQAVDKHQQYRALLTATSVAARAIEIDGQWAFVDDASESPNPRGYAVPRQVGRLRFRGSYQRAIAADLHRASEADDSLNAFIRHYSTARTSAKLGRLDDTIGGFAATLDLALGDYEPTPSEAKFGRPRLFIEKSSTLMALDWCRTHYRYVLEYVRKPSFALGGNPLMYEKYPDRAFRRMFDDNQWQAIIDQCEWDELLKHRRNAILRELNSLADVLRARRHQLRWDLARVVRARNMLVHEGQPIQDEEYLPGLLLDTLDLILRLRVAAIAKGLSFNDLLHLADQDFNQLTAGSTIVSSGRFAVFGWRAWSSARGLDLLPAPP